MRIAVRYQSKGGSTRKVAEAIARKAGVVAKPLDAQEKLANIDLLFVGGGIYAGSPHKSFTETVGALKADQIGCIALFSTTANPDPKMTDKLKPAITDPAIKILEASFHCPGTFLLANRQRPNETDLSAAEAFAKKAIDARRKALEAKK